MNVTDSQRLLAAAGYYNAGIDGDWGPKSQAAANKLLDSRASEIPGYQRWGAERRRIAASQMILKYAGYDEVGKIDGFWGPFTRHALENWNHFQTYGKKPDNWREDDVPQDEDDGQEELEIQHWPLQRGVTKFFGQPGGPQCTAGKVILPFKMRIAWNRSQTVSQFSCHEKVADSMERVYRKVASAYSPQDITRLGFDLFGGCYNFRKMRGGSSYSMHSWGIAVDHDPERNQLKWGRDRAFLARPECEEFWRIWESEGWLSLGRARNYDWMHVQAARL